MSEEQTLRSEDIRFPFITGDDGTAQKDNNTERKSGWDTSTVHFGLPMEISPTDSWLSEEHQIDFESTVT